MVYVINYKKPEKEMAPVSKLAIERLVDAISNLDVKVTSMQQKINDCYDIIAEQKESAINRDLKIDSIATSLDQLIKSLNMSTNLPEKFNEATSLVQPTTPPLSKTRTKICDRVPLKLCTNTLHNDSGPEGITVIHTPDDSILTQKDDTVTQDLNDGQLPSQPIEKAPATSTPATHNRRWEHHVLKTPPPRNIDTVLQTAPPPPVAPSAPAAPSASSAPPVNTEQTTITGLRAAPPRIASLHLFNFIEETTPEDIKGHLMSHLHLVDVRCEQLPTRGRYSSFKLDIPIAKVNQVRNPKLWPDGVSIRKFNEVSPKNFKGQKLCPNKL